MAKSYTMAPAKPAILSYRFVGPNKRFRVEKFRTRFDTIEYFGFDANDISDAEVRRGKLIEPFAQGTLREVLSAVAKRVRGG